MIFPGTCNNTGCMSNQPSWLIELLAVANASVEAAEIPTFEIGLLVSGHSFGFTAPPALISDGSKATAWLEGSQATFQQIIEGSLTPQQAFLSGLLSCRGEPESLLRFTALLEACSGSRRQ